jgi:hypothetical protein
MPAPKELDNGFRQEAHDKELLEALSFDDDALSLATPPHSLQKRAKGAAEYAPVPVGGLSVYFNRHPGAMPRKRPMRKYAHIGLRRLLLQVALSSGRLCNVQFRYIYSALTKNTLL